MKKEIIKELSLLTIKGPTKFYLVAITGWYYSASKPPEELTHYGIEHHEGWMMREFETLKDVEKYLQR